MKDDTTNRNDRRSSEAEMLQRKALSRGVTVEERRGGLAANPRRFRIVYHGRACTGWMTATETAQALDALAGGSRNGRGEKT